MATGIEPVFWMDEVYREAARDMARRLDNDILRNMMPPPRVKPKLVHWYDRDDAGRAPDVWIDYDKFKVEIGSFNQGTWEGVRVIEEEEEPTDADLWKSGVEGIYPRAWQFRIATLDYELVFADGSIGYVPEIAFLHQNGNLLVTRP